MIRLVLPLVTVAALIVHQVHLTLVVALSLEPSQTHNRRSTSSSSRTRQSTMNLSCDSNELKRSSSSVPDQTMRTRRDVFQMLVQTATVSATACATITSQPAFGFDNKISTKYDDRPKRRGTKPKDLGVATRYDLGGAEYTGLKPCGPAPNCFVSTDNPEDDPDHVIPSWKWPTSTKDSAQAWDDFVDTISKYQPGQSNVDGGGFNIVTNDSQKKYLYVQFESLKNGYIDDFEAWISQSSPAVEIRSSSRLGYLDFGVNAKRLNFIAKSLREKGWDAPGVEYKSHQNYVIQNELE